MEAAFWDQVAAEGHRLPEGRPLADLTAELTTMLGDPDPRRREQTAHRILTTWIATGVYDDLLEGLGDGMAAGLDAGIGQDGSDTVFRRCCSARVLTACLERDNAEHLLRADTVLRWGDRIVTWLLRERDLRGYVAGKGWAKAVANGADAIGVLAGSAAVGSSELTVLLDVLVDRLRQPTAYRFSDGTDDRLALATMRILRRDLVEEESVEEWLDRVADCAAPPSPEAVAEEAFVVCGNAQAYLRAVHVQLAIAADPPARRGDLLLAVIDRLKQTNAAILSR